jgi:hypothetical protein
MEADENRSIFSIVFFSTNNLLMLATLACSGVVLAKMAEK